MNVPRIESSCDETAAVDPSVCRPRHERERRGRQLESDSYIDHEQARQ